MVLMNELKRKKKSKVLLLFLFVFLSVYAFSQQNISEINFLFYNVENLFDIYDDPETLDDEFTPRGSRFWSYKRFSKKIKDVSRVILSSAGWSPPEIIGLCEIENRYVLDKLLKETPLKAFPYGVVHKESPDMRGIDVAFLYNKDFFYPLEYNFIPLQSENDSVLNTREILYVSGILAEIDTIHLFVNHWPSRYSGLLESESLRKLAAQTLKAEIKLLQDIYRNPMIVITGDFNDQPDDDSVFLHLGAKKTDGESSFPSGQIFNLSYSWLNKEPGTLKFQTQWSVFDHIMVTGNLLNQSGKLYTRPDWAQIVKHDFLLEKDERYGGIKPKRTYTGFKYNGGFSDHLPVMLKIGINR